MGRSFPWRRLLPAERSGGLQLQRLVRLRAVGSNTFSADFSEGAQGFSLEGEIVTPWRVVVLARDLDGLVKTTLIDNLVPAPDPALFADTSYIHPGRCVWRWQIRQTGTVADQKQYADFAAQLGYEYSLVDEGWEKEWTSSMADLAETFAPPTTVPRSLRARALDSVPSREDKSFKLPLSQSIERIIALWPLSRGEKTLKNPVRYAGTAGIAPVVGIEQTFR